MMSLSTDSKRPAILSHLRWVAKIALSVGALAATGLAIVLYALTDTSGASYHQLIQSHSVAQQYLGPTLLIGGCFLLAFTAVITWLIALYSSLRIAGPLFRFSRNLETSIAQGPTRPIPIREDDELQRETRQLADAIAAVSDHYAGLRNEIDRILRKLDSGALEPEGFPQASARLKRQAERVRV